MSTALDAIDPALRPFSEADKLAACKARTGSLPKRYAKEIAAGMTDAQLAGALGQAIGILGGSRAQGKKTGNRVPGCWPKNLGRQG